MPGFLDVKSPSIEAEYARYIDGDVMGKIIFKSFLIHRIGLPITDIYIPLGRHGDSTCAGDAMVVVGSRRRSVEIKCANCNIVNRTIKDRDGRKNWAFAGLLKTPKGSSRSFDLAFCVGIQTLGLEDSRYWTDLVDLQAKAKRQGRDLDLTALPHQPSFLDRCCFFIMPRRGIVNTYFRVNVGAVAENKYQESYAWGYDMRRCRAIWGQALND